MSKRSIAHVFACLAGFALAGCAAYSSEMGPDALSNSEASRVTWTDGDPAIAIQCLQARGCSQRARAMCRLGSLKVLRRQGLSPADESEAAPHAPSVIVRCV